MYCIGYNDIYPIFETVAIKIFNSEKIINRTDLILNTFDKVLSNPYFNGINAFNEYVYFKMNGMRKVSTLTDTSWTKIREMIFNSELKSVGLHTKQEIQYNLRNNSIMYAFGEESQPKNFGMNKLCMYITEDSFKRNTEFLLFNYFVELCELLEACYGFACIHVDSTDSQAVTECYKNTIKFLPIDCINSSKYITDSNKVIKDVCWLNFISNDHLQQLTVDCESFLSSLPFYKKTDRGVYFAIANEPYMGEESYSRIKQLRDIFKPIICEENWYNFA